MTPRERRLRTGGRCILSLVLLASLAGFGTTVLAQPAVRVGPEATPAFKPARPWWLELTVAQRQALTPLADDWERLDFQTKKKWVEISNRYPRMSADEQARSQERMREWAMLTPDQRRVARDSFARVRAMNPEQRAELLRKYQELPPEKRNALTHEGRANKALVVPKQVPPPASRRGQISEGAKTRNPALAAQKSASPLVAPAIHPPAPVAP